MMKKIFLGTDHAGFEMKEKIREFLIEQGFEVEDCGCYSADSCDYPDFIIPTAEKTVKNNESFGIVLGGSGQGEALAANKVKGARAVVINSENLELVKLTRIHNNANILSLGARFLDFEIVKEIITIFLETEFEGDRHIRRLEKIATYENL